jgi:hypothetical protein
VGRCGLDSSVQEKDRWQALVNMVMNLQVLSGSIPLGSIEERKLFTS